ncbi:hypothetical protein Ancab_005855 [Ancistrocladus abbreviatus]
MKSLINGGEFIKSPRIVKISAFLFLSIAFFYIGMHWSDGYNQLIFFTATITTTLPPSVSLSPNFNKSFDIPSLISSSYTDNTTSSIGSPPPPPASPPPPPPTSPSPPPLPAVTRFGIVDENGMMTEDFEVGAYDPEAVETWGNAIEAEDGDGGELAGNGVRAPIRRFPLCPLSMSEYIPCMDNVEAIKKLKSTDKGKRFERHCPEKGKQLNCLVPAPKRYKTPIPWPRSRNEVWYNNVPHTHLVEDKGGQNWIMRNKDKFIFPRVGTQFIRDADQYLDQISQMIPDILFGRHTRVVLDVGCGVASFGAYLMSRNVITLSIAPKDVRENQIQFALERGVPAMVVAFATHRLPYPSQAFDLIHCSRCRVNWTRDDGILLLEVNRILRAGGYFAWAAQPAYDHEVILEGQWKDMVNLTTRLCWELVKKEGYVAIWRKPLNNSCYLSRQAGTQPPICDPDDDPDNAWYVNLNACITRLPDNGYGANVPEWPARLQAPPDRLQSIKFDAYISRKELFKAESKFWDEVVEGYVRALHWKKIRLRNVMDMRAGFGGCEPFDTYPRTYDLLHAAGLFSVERKRCNITGIMLEMDRIVRPGGRVYIRDSLSVIDELTEIAKAVGWHVSVRDTSEGPHASYRVLQCDKRLLRG